MRILQVNKYLYCRAGAEAYVLELSELLVKHGHEVGLWGCRPPSPYPLPSGERIKVRGEYLLEPLDYDRREGIIKDLKKFGHMVWSREAAKKFDTLLRRWRPDIIHIHNIYHHLSPSILAVARRYKIPVVQTLHDFKWLCPNYKLFTLGAPCQRCQRYRYWNVVRYKCAQNLLAASGAAAMEMWFHRWLGIYEKNIAKFITPSDFLRKLLIQWGKDKDKIVTIHNFVPLMMSSRGATTLSRGDVAIPSGLLHPDRDVGVRNDSRCNYILFAGRLAEEKGIWLLLEIAKTLPEIKFKIAGTGPEIENVKCKMKNEKLLNVELLGFQKKEELQKLIAEARLVVAPSLWYENYPMSVLEAQAAGKLVLASATGGLPEMIEDGKTGFLISSMSSRGVPPIRRGDAAIPYIDGIASPPMADRNDASLWVDKIKQIYHDDALLKKVGQAARERVLKENDPEKHYQQIMDIYKTV